MQAFYNAMCAGTDAMLGFALNLIEQSNSLSFSVMVMIDLMVPSRVYRY